MLPLVQASINVQFPTPYSPLNFFFTDFYWYSRDIHYRLYEC